MNIAVTAALPTDEPLIQNLMQFYTHDFSEFWAGTSKGDLQANGRFSDYPLTDYWTRPHWSASLIWSNQVLAGFVLLNDQAHSGRSVDRNVAEFFILRKHRGFGVGRAAAALVFSRHPGSWEVAVARKNIKACQFWRTAIANTPAAVDIQEFDVINDHWNGPIYRFIANSVKQDGEICLPL